MLALPLFRLLMIQETALLAAKFRGVHRPTPVNILTRDELVQHLVEDHVFHNVAWNKRLVQEAVDADQAVAFLVRTEAYGRPLALGRAATPGNLRLHAIDEIALIQVTVDGFEIEIPPARL